MSSIRQFAGISEKKGEGEVGESATRIEWYEVYLHTYCTIKGTCYQQNYKQITIYRHCTVFSVIILERNNEYLIQQSQKIQRATTTLSAELKFSYAQQLP